MQKNAKKAQKSRWSFVTLAPLIFSVVLDYAAADALALRSPSTLPPD